MTPSAHEAKVRMRAAQQEAKRAAAAERNTVVAMFAESVMAAERLVDAAVVLYLAHEAFRAALDADYPRPLDEMSAEEMLLLMDRNDDADEPAVWAALRGAIEATEGWVGRDGVVQMIVEALDRGMRAG